MNILVIGNGFDLAHDLPTKYTDFLKFITSFTECYEKVQSSQIDWAFYDTSKEVNAFLEKWFSAYYENENGQSKSEKRTTVKIIEELNDNIDNNVWIEYFLQNPMYKKENWIDFESEISKVVQSIDTDIRWVDVNAKVEKLSDPFLSIYFLGNENIRNLTGILKEFGDTPVETETEKITYKQLKDKLLDDLNKLIRALEIYLSEYVEKIEIEKKSPDIDGLEVDFILSFNYTHIFSRLYNVSSRSQQEIANPFDFIHGEANISNTVETNNMVLGIDEYLSKKRRNKEIEFIEFKKYYQRIYKQTGNEYKRWVEIIKNQIQEIDDKTKKQYPVQIPYNKIPNKCRNQLFIFGHSLDITDKDILRELILNDNVYTTIFYYNRDVMGQQIANLVKAIGQDELIRRTGGSTKTIEFVPQKPMEPINK